MENRLDFNLGRNENNTGGDFTRRCARSVSTAGWVFGLVVPAEARWDRLPEAAVALADPCLPVPVAAPSEPRQSPVPAHLDRPGAVADCRRSRWLRQCRRCRRRVIALQLEEDRRHLERHLVARVHVRVDLGVQLVHLVVPRIGLQPEAQRMRRPLRQVVPVQLGRHVLQARHPRRPVRLQQRIAQLGRVQLPSAPSRGPPAAHSRGPHRQADPCTASSADTPSPSWPLPRCRGRCGTCRCAGRSPCRGTSAGR